MEISKTGVVLETDNNDCIVKQASQAKIQDKWLLPLQVTIDAHLAAFGDNLRSVYVRGSLPLGQARDFVSDIDLFSLVDCHPEEISLTWRDTHIRQVKRRFPFVKHVEILVYPTTTVKKRRSLAALIKTQSACIYGVDFDSHIPCFKPGIELMLHSWELPKDLAIARRAVETMNDSDDVRQACTWIMKRLIRCGFELTMERARCYTRDLYPCYQIFAKYYSYKADLMAEALELAVNPSSDCEHIQRVIDELGEWLFQEICMEFGAARIEQLLQARAGNQ